MIRYILTHPGGAHKDELLAVCVLIAKYGVPVVRRDPSPEELSDSTVAVVDVGSLHQPAKMNFDHHQFERDHAPICALSLVLDHLGLYEDASHLCDWLEPTEWFDSRGPKKTAEMLGVPRRAISQLNSPFDITLLRRFALLSELSPGEPLYEFMRFAGEDLLEYLKVARQRMDFVKKHVEHWSIEHSGEVVEAVFLPRTEPPAEEPSSSLANYIRSQKIEDTVAAIVYPDRRGDGYGIGRYEDHPRLDFSLVKDEPDVHFAHNSGFMCKTSATDRDRLRTLVTMAWLPKQ